MKNCISTPVRCKIFRTLNEVSGPLRCIAIKTPVNIAGACSEITEMILPGINCFGERLLKSVWNMAFLSGVKRDCRRCGMSPLPLSSPGLRSTTGVGGVRAAFEKG